MQGTTFLSSLFILELCATRLQLTSIFVYTLLNLYLINSFRLPKKSISLSKQNPKIEKCDIICLLFEKVFKNDLFQSQQPQSFSLGEFFVPKHFWKILLKKTIEFLIDQFSLSLNLSHVHCLTLSPSIDIDKKSILAF